MDARRSTTLYTARQHAYDSLKRTLLAGDFPLGARLAEERLAARIGVSRTPIREALARLHAEHIVERHPDGGFMPRPPDLHSTRHLYEIRFALERAALSRPELTGEPHDPEVVAHLVTEWESLVPDSAAGDAGIAPDPSFVLLDEDFHVRLAGAAGNDELAMLLVSVNERIRPVRMHDFLSADRIASTIEQHLGILDAVRTGRLGGALRALDAHLAESLAEVEVRAARALANMVARRGTR